jgi:hypothetical protein
MWESFLEARDSYQSQKTVKNKIQKNRASPVVEHFFPKNVGIFFRKLVCTLIQFLKFFESP